MTELPAEPKTASEDTGSAAPEAGTPEFRYVEEFVRYQLGQSLGGARGMIESALPFVAFTIAWVIGRQLYPAIEKDLQAHPGLIGSPHLAVDEDELHTPQ